GATVHRVKGTIADAGKFLREHGPKGAFGVSTLREPYRIEGKKTMAYELVEQMRGEVPDVVLYPRVAAPASSACGKRSMRWNASDGSPPADGRGSSPCKPQAVHR